VEPLIQGTKNENPYVGVNAKEHVFRKFQASYQY